VSGNGSGAAAGSGREDGERRRGTENFLGLAASNSSYILRYWALHSWAIVLLGRSTL
jgi:hypothetical protein